MTALIRRLGVSASVGALFPVRGGDGLTFATRRLLLTQWAGSR